MPLWLFAELSQLLGLEWYRRCSSSTREDDIWRSGPSLLHWVSDWPSGIWTCCLPGWVSLDILGFGDCKSVSFHSSPLLTIAPYLWLMVVGLMLSLRIDQRSAVDILFFSRRRNSVYQQPEKSIAKGQICEPNTSNRPEAYYSA